MKSISPQKAAVQRLIELINSEYHRIITLDELAETARYSKYHLERIFLRKTGLSIAQYISLVRIEKSKELLLDPRFSVSEVSAQVGYTSISTFSRTFKEYVGVQPNLYRRLHRNLEERTEKELFLTDNTPFFPSRSEKGIIRGCLTADRPVKGVILIGLFSQPAPKGFPVSCTMLRETGTFELEGAEDGHYYAFAVALEFPLYSPHYSTATHSLRGRTHLPVRIQNGKATEAVAIHLRPPLVTDPPISVSPLYLLQNFVGRFPSREQSRIKKRDEIQVE